MNQRANLKSMTRLPPVWYNEQVGGNVLSFAEIKDHPSYELDYNKVLEMLYKLTVQKDRQTKFANIFCEHVIATFGIFCANPNVNQVHLIFSFFLVN